MMTDAQIRRLRRHREEMQLAIAEHLTLDQARDRLRSYRSHLKRLAGEAIAMPAPAQKPAAIAAAAKREPTMWWQHD